MKKQMNRLLSGLLLAVALLGCTMAAAAGSGVSADAATIKTIPGDPGTVTAEISLVDPANINTVQIDIQGTGTFNAKKFAGQSDFQPIGSKVEQDGNTFSGSVFLCYPPSLTKAGAVPVASLTVASSDGLSLQIQQVKVSGMNGEQDIELVIPEVDADPQEVILKAEKKGSSVEVQVSARQANLLAARYNSQGRMLELKSLPVGDEGFEILRSRISFSAGKGTVKLFLLDRNTGAPLCPSQTL